MRPENSEFGNKEMLPMPKELDEELIKKTEEQLEIIKDSLHDFTKNIEEEKPDMVILLDKGARIFGEPIFKYLDERKLPKMPEIRFYNDDYLKGLYLDGKLDIKSAEAEFSCLKGKKVFFLDETFSSGKGAATLKKVKEYLGNDDIFYFALTRDKGPKALDEFDVWFKLPIEEHIKNLDGIKQDKNFKIYDNDIGALFSKEASQLYIAEVPKDGRVQTEWPISYEEAMKNREKSGLDIPSAYEYDIREYPCDKKTYYKLVEKQKRNTARAIKQKILETLKSKD